MELEPQYWVRAAREQLQDWEPPGQEEQQCQGLAAQTFEVDVGTCYRWL